MQTVWEALKGRVSLEAIEENLMKSYIHPNRVFSWNQYSMKLFSLKWKWSFSIDKIIRDECIFQVSEKVPRNHFQNLSKKFIADFVYYKEIGHTFSENKGAGG